MEGLRVLPENVKPWGGYLVPGHSVAEARDNNRHAFELVDIRPSPPGNPDEQKIVVHVTDINNKPVMFVPVVFAFSTGPDTYPRMEWAPEARERRAQVILTNYAGVAEQVQGSPVKKGDIGGVDVFVADESVPSVTVIGMGMLHDHTGIYLRFVRMVPGELTLEERVELLEGLVSANNPLIREG